MSTRLLVEKQVATGGGMASDQAGKADRSGKAGRAGKSDGAGKTDRGGKVGRRISGRSVTVNLAESPLGWLKARGHVSGRQYDAGEQLRADWERAQLAPSVTMRWDAAPQGRGGAGPALDPTSSQIAAKRRFEAAVTAVGPGLDDILWRIACAGEGMRDAEQALGWPARAGKLVLGLALDRLADHYGMR